MLARAKNLLGKRQNLHYSQAKDFPSESGALLEIVFSQFSANILKVYFSVVCRDTEVE